MTPHHRNWDRLSTVWLIAAVVRCFADGDLLVAGVCLGIAMACEVMAIAEAAWARA